MLHKQNAHEFMKNKMKFKIGEFSKLCQVTVKTLRHYEEIGLMIPVEVMSGRGIAITTSASSGV